jgi:hypothetical protein
VPGLEPRPSQNRRQLHVIHNLGDRGESWPHTGGPRPTPRWDDEEAALRATGEVGKGEDVMRIIVRFVSPPAYAPAPLSPLPPARQVDEHAIQAHGSADEVGRRGSRSRPAEACALSRCSRARPVASLRLIVRAQSRRTSSATMAIWYEQPFPGT